ncbi:ankyrin repeat protein [Xylogone sp. PMI_703]|nr:ankyrin repeat protein [Xylogone sp. PMI_703]
MSSPSLKSCDLYTIGWIAALPLELAAATAMLDEEHEKPPEFVQPRSDTNSYSWGRIGEHNVVIASLAAGKYGTTSAATTAIFMLSSFPQIRIGFLVGIGAGIARPDQGCDIRLGDIAVSQPHGNNGGVIQYDLFKAKSGNQQESRAFLNCPPEILLKALAKLQAQHERKPSKVSEYLAKMATDNPKMVKSKYEILREQRESTEPEIHYGVIASGNTLFKDATYRDKILKDIGEECICFEMEAAGLMNNFPCIVIRGICDYADLHKSDRWQRYAAAVAAAYAKELLGYVPTQGLQETQKAIDRLKDMEETLENLIRTTGKVEFKVNSAEEQKILNWLSDAKISTNYHKSLQGRTPGTGQWLLNSETYKSWRDHPQGLLWIYGAAGCGKTVLCSTVIQNISEICLEDSNVKHAYWYFQFSDVTTQNTYNMIRSFIRQLSPSPLLASTRKLWEKHNKAGSKPTLDELANVLHEIINHSKKAFFIMDALDECPQTSVVWKEQPCLNISMNIEKWADVDVKMFVKEKMSSDSLSECESNLKTKIEESLLSTEERRFRWVDLQIRRLNNCNSEDQINDALKTIPESLEATYKETLDNIPAKDKGFTREILMWLCFSFQPVTLREIAAAVNLLRPEYALRICTSMLVTLIHENTDEVIRLAHFTVKEYLVLQKESENGSEFRFTDESAQASLANTTVKYLLDTNKSSDPTSLSDKYLLGYSARFWYQHAIIVVEKDEYSRLLELINLLFSPKYKTSYNCDDPYYHQTEYPQPLYYAALLSTIVVHG